MCRCLASPMSQDDPYAAPPDEPTTPGERDNPYAGRPGPPTEPVPPPPSPGQPYGHQAYGQAPPPAPQPGYGQRPPPPPQEQPPAAAYYQWPTQSPVLPVGVYAGSMGARLVARIIDFCVVGLPVALLFVFVTLGALAGADVDPVTGDLVLSDQDATQLVIGLVLATIATVVLSILYEVWMTAVKGATLGKMVMGLKVVDMDTGDVIGWGRSFVRWVIPTIGNMVCFVGGLVVYLSAFFDSAKANRGWHDLAARDVVIDVRRSQPSLP
jgi:uncharacterized RDD family membrane protein YckC